MANDTTRIYVVYKTDGSGEQLVRAGHKYAAHRYVTFTQWGVRLAKPEDVVRLLGKGVKVENAGADGATADLYEPDEPTQKSGDLLTITSSEG